MKVIFVCSGNSEHFQIAPFIQSQGNSLATAGIDVDYYLIHGKGLSGYFSNIKKLKEKLKQNKYDIIHSHYVLSGWIAVMSFPGVPVITSFMGTDTYGDVNSDGKRKIKSYLLILSGLLLQFFLDFIIVKSPNLLSYIYRKRKAAIIPNGVDLEKFRVNDDPGIRKRLGLPDNKKLVLFLGNKADPRKNYQLAEEVIKIIDEPDYKLINPYPVEPQLIPDYLNAVNVLILTSWLEGSPNVIKEAMACNLPIVTTDVGDAGDLIDDVPGCHMTSFDKYETAKKIKEAIDFVGQTTGREKIKSMELDIDSVAQKLIKVYDMVIRHKQGYFGKPQNNN